MSKSKHTVVVLITTVVDGTTSVDKVTKTLDQEPTSSSDDVDVYTSTVTEDGEVKVVTGTLFPDNRGVSSGARSLYTPLLATSTKGMSAVLVALLMASIL
ncbi:hypothetical protein FB639_003528 [Coemansia asiatica]|nr:hypothetical protein FB639_003528 [Coemansia asiatica]